MTLGDGIFYSTLLLIAAAAVYQLSVRHKWKLVGKVIGVIVVLGAAVGGGWYAWDQHRNRPVEMTELWGIELGMTPTEVTLAKGKASLESDPETSGETTTMAWTFTTASTNAFDAFDDERFTFVRFETDASNDMAVDMVCQRRGPDRLLGLGHYSSEDDVLRKLGEPAHTAVKADGLLKMINYAAWNVGYELERGAVITVCIFSGEKGIGYTATDDAPSRPLRDLLSTETTPPPPAQ